MEVARGGSTSGEGSNFVEGNVDEASRGVVPEAVRPLVRVCLLRGLYDRVFCGAKAQDGPRAARPTDSVPFSTALFPRPWPTHSPLQLPLSLRVAKGHGSADGRQRAAKMPAVIGLRRTLVEPVTDLFLTQDNFFATRAIIVLSRPAEGCIGGISKMPMMSGRLQRHGTRR